MLKMIQCDEFKNTEGQRGAIIFHNGLNAVIGNESGTNSVGKSTFLMILDFVFGGEDYMTKSKEVHRNIPPHSINFIFEFDGTEYYFSRNTGDSTVVSVCDENFKLKEEWTIKEYTSFLAKHYGLTQDGITFRNAMSRFIRVDRRECMDEEKPFKQFKKEKDRDSILSILKLIGKYSIVEKQEKIATNLSEREKTFTKAQAFEYIPKVKNQTEYKKNEVEIGVLKKEAEELAEKSSDGLLDLSSIQAEELQILKGRLSGFRRERAKLMAQKGAIARTRNEAKKTFQPNYQDLEEFFSNINVEKLATVENFHRKLTKILKSELSENEADIDAMIELADCEISNVEKQIKEIAQLQNVSKAILEKYANIRKKLQTLADANAAYDKKNALHDEAVKAQKELDDTILREMSKFQQKLNTKLEELNDYLYDDYEMEAPRLHVKSANEYEFYTPDDGGAGMRYKGLALFDIAMLDLTNIPFIVHDTVLLLQVEREAVERLLELYSRTNKQVFIAFDKDTTDRGWEILKDAELQRFTRGGNELFGRPFNKKKKENTETESDTAE